MFSAITGKLSKELAHTKDVISWQAQLRTALNLPPDTAPSINIGIDAINELKQQAPDKVAWQLFDHCAAVSRIYGLFEQAVEELVAEYIKYISKVTPDYSNLLEDTRVQYRMGVALILSKWKDSKSLYSHLSEDAIAAGLADGLRKKPYLLLPDAFLTDSDNYRTDTVNRIFRRLGLEDVFAGIRKAPSIVAFCSTLSQTADSYLNEFVRVRNDAAHGSVNSVSSSNEILGYATFIDLVIKELASLLLSHAIRNGVTSGYSKTLGVVKNVYRNNVVGISSSSDLTIKNGDKLYAGKKSLEPVNVVSLQIGHVPHTEIKLSSGLEFGLGLDKQIPVGAALYCWQ